MKCFKIILLAFFALMVIFAIIIGIVFHATSRLDTTPISKTILVRYGSNSNAVYLKTKIYGIAGDHEEIVLSKSKESITDHKVDYVFYSPEVFYKVVNDIIYIYAPQSSISEPIEQIPNVVIEKLRSHEEIKDYNDNYSRYGLERISVYQ